MLIVYGIPDEHWTVLTLIFLDEQKIEHKFINVNEDRMAYDFCLEQTGQDGFPVIKKGKVYVVGLFKEKLVNLSAQQTI